MTVAVVAEKPSVARDLARVLGADTPFAGGFRGAGWAVTWLVGHAAELAEPGALDPQWRTWRLEDLPILPRTIPWRVTEAGRARFEAVRAVLQDPEVDRVVCATDAGREGELIFRSVAELVGLDKPVERLWISSMTDAAIQAGLSNLRPSADFDGLARAAVARAYVDWWVGMNASRALTLTHGEPLSAGRVQTPTLRLVVDRDRARAAHRPSPFAELMVRLEDPQGGGEGLARLARDEASGPARDEASGPARDQASGSSATRFEPDDPRLDRAQSILPGAEVFVERLESETRALSAPPLHDLDLLQQDAHASLGLTARETLDVAQRLYERHKLISYPRTDSRRLDSATAQGLPALTRAVAARLGLDPEPLELERHVDDGAVRDHPAIIPLGDPPPSGLDPTEAEVFALIERRLLAAHAPPIRVAVTRVELGSEAGVRLVADGLEVLAPGWGGIEPAGLPASTPLPAGWAEGVVARVVGVQRIQRLDGPPAPIDDASLIEAMAEQGLGTPATRADTIETAIARGYLERRIAGDEAEPAPAPRAGRPRRHLVSTALGRGLIDRAPTALTAPRLTAEIEGALGELARGRLAFDAFVDRAHRFVELVVAAVASKADLPPELDEEDPDRAAVATEPPVERPRKGEQRGELDRVLDEGIHADVIGPLTERVARGEDVALSVASPWMLTRYGLRLASAGGGPTVILSSLPGPALDDEVMQLRSLGLRADRLRAGQTDGEARAICRDYLDGRLEALFVAAERLEVEGLARMLARGRPGAAIVDDAARASPWHPRPCRPLVELGPTSLTCFGPEVARIAVSAAASALVTRDALERLGLDSAHRRSEPWDSPGLALEVVELEPRARPSAVGRALKGRGQGLVLTSSRPRAEALAAGLGVEAYHLGRSAADRGRLQRGFQEGDVSTLVATDALLERLDAPDLRVMVFDGLPTGLAALAGRAMGPSVLEDEVRVVVLHHPSDLEGHRDALDLREPPVEALELLARHLASSPVPLDGLRARVGLPDGTFERFVRALVRAGGARLEPAGLRAEDARWPARHRARRARGLEELEAVARWARSPGCRLVGLARALGYAADDECGLCDACDPDGAALSRYRPPTERESRIMQDILQILARGGPSAQGQLFRAIQSDEVGSRRAFDRLVSGLASAGLVRVSTERFVDGGRERVYARVAVERLGLDPAALRFVRIRQDELQGK